MQQVVDMVGLRAHDKGVGMRCSLSPGLPTALVGDQLRLRQVLLNLASNAVKFTDEGEVTLGVEAARESAKDVELLFSVADTGMGIPRDQLDLVFEPFQQADGSDVRKHGGTGLGLTISRQLVELMGGRMRVDSAPGKGSAFSFTVTLRKGVQVDTEHTLASPQPIAAADPTGH